jgi:myo-inositol-1(or 4)-monophosphatase
MTRDADGRPADGAARPAVSTTLRRRPAAGTVDAGQGAAEMAAAVDAARAAGEVLIGRLGSARVVRDKGAIDVVTDADVAAGRCIMERLAAATPSHGFLTEDSDAVAGSSGARWIVDPLDGTVNYLRSLPYFCVSIALERDGRLELGVIFDPLRNDLYAARHGQGATLNGQPIRVSAETSLSRAVVSTGFPYDAWQAPRDNTAEVGRIVKHVFALRSWGSAALDLAAVACGRLDLHWERGLHAYDVAAGVAIVREAGGVATDYAGGADALYRGEIIAGNAILQGVVGALFETVGTGSN